MPERSPGSPRPSITFDSTLRRFGNNTGIEVPPELIERLGAGQRPPVFVTVNGYEYRNTVGVMGGRHLIAVSATVRKATGLSGGDPITVTLTLATEPRVVSVPEDFADAMTTSGTRGFFDGLSNSLQRYHVDLVTGAKAEDTRRRRIDKAIGLFQAGKPR
jgi:hypothetical protein